MRMKFSEFSFLLDDNAMRWSFQFIPICLLLPLYDKLDGEENYIEKISSKVIENENDFVQKIPPPPAEKQRKINWKTSRFTATSHSTLLDSLSFTIAASLYAISIKINEAKWNAMWIGKQNRERCKIYFDKRWTKRKQQKIPSSNWTSIAIVVSTRLILPQHV